MGISRSTYYFEIRKPDVVAERNKDLLDEIKDIFKKNMGRYGVRRVYQERICRGHTVNHERVQRLMHEAGLLGKRPKEKYHSHIGEVGKVAENRINGDLSTTAPLQKWTTDVTPFHFSWGKCYFSPILDMHTNEILSYAQARSPDRKQMQRMLTRAFGKFPNLSGSDQGWQYQHADYRSQLAKHGIQRSMSRKGNCYDNSIMETFFGRMKNEMYYGCEKEYRSLDGSSDVVKSYMDHDNNDRIQKKTKWMPPVKYREASICAV